MTTNNSPEALADRLEEAALASLPFGSGELAEALAEANAVRRGEEPWGDVTVSDMQVALAERDARIARAAEGLVAASRAPIGSGSYIPWAAWDRLVEAVEGEEPVSNPDELPVPAECGAQGEPPAEAVLDLMEALKASLRAARPGWKPGDDPAAPAEGGAE